MELHEGGGVVLIINDLCVKNKQKKWPLACFASGPEAWSSDH